MADLENLTNDEGSIEKTIFLVLSSMFLKPGTADKVAERLNLLKRPVFMGNYPSVLELIEDLASKEFIREIPGERPAIDYGFNPRYDLTSKGIDEMQRILGKYKGEYD